MLITAAAAQQMPVSAIKMAFRAAMRDYDYDGITWPSRFRQKEHGRDMALFHFIYKTEYALMQRRFARLHAEE